jgi:hypothetical protein
VDWRRSIEKYYCPYSPRNYRGFTTRRHLIRIWFGTLRARPLGRLPGIDPSGSNSAKRYLEMKAESQAEKRYEYKKWVSLTQPQPSVVPAFSSFPQRFSSFQKRHRPSDTPSSPRHPSSAWPSRTSPANPA